MIDVPMLVHDYVTRDRESESGKLWPSSLGGCVRKEIYRLRGTEQTHPMPEPTQWKLHRYGWYEQPIAQALRHEYGSRVEVQVPVQNKSWSGKLDILVWDGPGDTGHADIYEVKSISPYAVNKSGLPYEHHRLQAQAYWALFCDSYRDPPRAVQIAYISRWDDDDVPILRQFDVTPAKEELAEVRAAMQVFEMYAEKDELPSRPWRHPSDHRWECMSQFWNSKTKSKPYVAQCPYFGHCWKGYVDPDRGYVENDSWDDSSFIPF